MELENILIPVYTNENFQLNPTYYSFMKVSDEIIFSGYIKLNEVYIGQSNQLIVSDDQKNMFYSMCQLINGVSLTDTQKIINIVLDNFELFSPLFDQMYKENLFKPVRGHYNEI